MVGMKRTEALKGFTVFHLLLLIVLLTLLVLVSIPFFRKAKERATQVSTMADMTMWGRALASYIEDEGTAPTNPRGELSYKKPIIMEAAPYLDAIRIVDWWGHRFWIWTGAGNREYGIITKSPKDFMIVSMGKEGLREGWGYDPDNPDAGFFEVKSLEDFENDLIMWNNTFIRCPKK